MGVALALGLTACGNGNDQTEPAASEPLATVNGHTITQEQYEAYLEQRTQGQPERLTPEEREALLQVLVDLTLLAGEAENQGLLEDPKLIGQLQNIRNEVLTRRLVEWMEAEGVSDEEVRAAYEERFVEEGALEYKASHILVEDEETARELLAQIEEGANFAAVAEEHSLDPGSARNGGDLGWFPSGAMVDSFSAAVRAMEPGQMTEEPIETQFGWHIILLEDTREARPPEFADVQDGIRQMLAQERLEQRLEELREQVDIDIQAQP
ncbi:hypothetical protein CAI21_14030 [Alkalilimnicola ehrlichii]|uniref:peptidylprolyl isomerase n=2 Tax=Alkalilimnicola ehrlichii TaxID=351052 RepID=A0A3E0WY28_9GAMM|nr:hypothetical protein CAI21_14030 [Alkalilimnicola ehrlichii]RFA36926.1 hypothetical protein CAL65_10500 [Alkalilimnicola ehrlichii]